MDIAKVETVDKPWGKEIWWAHAKGLYMGKTLEIKNGHRLSMQYHEQKDESIYVLDGTLVLELGDGENLQQIILNEGGTWHITPGTIHRFCAPPTHDVKLIEVSTPEIDDVVRIEDDYGR